MKQLQARTQWFLLVTNRIESAKQVTWDDAVSNSKHVEGTYTANNVRYDIVADLVNGDLTPRIQLHNQPKTSIGYAWG